MTLSRHGRRSCISIDSISPESKPITCDTRAGMRNAHPGFFHAGLADVDGAAQAIKVGQAKFPQCGWNHLPFVSTHH
jgi:hypothetical protein